MNKYKLCGKKNCKAGLLTNNWFICEECFLYINRIKVID